jgi:hypothetical protein
MGAHCTTDDITNLSIRIQNLSERYLSAKPCIRTTPARQRQWQVWCPISFPPLILLPSQVMGDTKTYDVHGALHSVHKLVVAISPSPILLPCCRCCTLIYCTPRHSSMNAMQRWTSERLQRLPHRICTILIQSILFLDCLTASAHLPNHICSVPTFNCVCGGAPRVRRENDRAWKIRIQAETSS